MTGSAYWPNRRCWYSYFLRLFVLISSLEEGIYGAGRTQRSAPRSRPAGSLMSPLYGANQREEIPVDDPTERFRTSLRAARAGASQREFAILLGISDKTLGRWERGEALPV